MTEDEVERRHPIAAGLMKLVGLLAFAGVAAISVGALVGLAVVSYRAVVGRF